MAVCGKERCLLARECDANGIYPSRAEPSGRRLNSGVEPTAERAERLPCRPNDPVNAAVAADAEPRARAVLCRASSSETTECREDLGWVDTLGPLGPGLALG